MKRTKLNRVLATLSAAVITLGVFSSCGSNKNLPGKEKNSNPKDKRIVVKVGTTSDEPRFWAEAQKNLDAAGENIEIQLVNLNPNNPNEFLAQGELDLNAFQHYAYFYGNIADLHLDLTAIGETVLVPLSLFSKTVSSLEELKAKKNPKITIPEDPTNQGRALLTIRNAGLIEVDPAVGGNGTLKDITSNPLGIQFIELPGPQLPLSIADADAGIINCERAVDAGFDPVNDPIYKDTVDPQDPQFQPYVNIIVARTKDKDNEVYRKVVEAFQQPNVAEAIRLALKNAAIVVWEGR